MYYARTASKGQWNSTIKQNTGLQFLASGLWKSSAFHEQLHFSWKAPALFMNSCAFHEKYRHFSWTVALFMKSTCTFNEQLCFSWKVPALFMNSCTFHEKHLHFSWTVVLFTFQVLFMCDRTCWDAILSKFTGSLPEYKLNNLIQFISAKYIYHRVAKLQIPT